MHTVIALECTGCELCVPVCPVDCIEMKPVTDRQGRDARKAAADAARARYRRREFRRARDERETATRLATRLG